MERDRKLRDSSAGLSTPAIGSSAALLPDPTHWMICLCAPARALIGDALDDTACIAVAVCVALFFALRLTLRYYFPPDTDALCRPAFDPRER